MTDSSDPKPAHTPYSALHSVPAGDGVKVRGAATAQSSPPEPDYLTIEADRLEHVKQSLYAALLAAPSAGIPTALVDLAATYTSALRLQMTLKGYTSVTQRSLRAPAFGAPKTR